MNRSGAAEAKTALTCNDSDIRAYILSILSLLTENSPQNRCSSVCQPTDGDSGP
jgi:hypothetical protein